MEKGSENIVMKFGGSCLVEQKDMHRTIEIVREMKKKARPILVPSALKGITDMLVEQSKLALERKHTISAIREKHYEVLENLKEKSGAKLKINALLDELENVLKGISYLGECSPATYDRILSFGERMSSVLLESYLNEANLPSKAFPDPILITDDVFCDATILPESENIIREKANALHDKILIFPGFIGKTVEGKVTTLGRGGSDYTATYIAGALGCPVILWKDTNGIMSADPKIVPDAKVVQKVNYIDAMELSHYGSKVIFGKAIKPVMEKKVSLYLKNFDNEKAEGTEISSEETTSMVISTVKTAEILNMTDYMEMSTFANIINGFAKNNIYPLLLVESSSLGELSIVVDEAKARHVEKIVRKEVVNVEIEKDVGIVSIISGSMRGKVGLAASAFGELAKNQINIIAISQSASERNISLVISKGDVAKAAQVLHGKFA